MAGIQLFNWSLAVDKQPLKIECTDVLKDGDTDYVVSGGAEGQLAVFERKCKGAMRLLVKRAVSKKAITRVSVVREPRRVVALSGAQVSIYRLEDLELECALKEASEVSAYDVWESAEGVRLAVVKRAKVLLLFEGVREASGGWWLRLVSEMASDEVPKMVRWVPTAGCERGRLLVGTKTGYWWVGASTGERKLIMPIEKGTALSAVVLHSDEYMLTVGKMVVRVQVEHQSKRSAIVLPEPPTGLSLSYPYLVVLTPRLCEARCVFAQVKLEQSFVIDGARSMATSTDAEHWRSSKLRCGGTVYVASRRQIWALDPLPVVEQLERLMGASRYEEASHFCRNLNRLDAPGRDRLLAKIQAQQAFQWFGEGQYFQAFQMFASLSVNALAILGLYPRQRWAWSGDEEESLLPEKWWRVTHAIEQERATRALTGVALERALRELVRYLWEERMRWSSCGDVDAAPLPPPPEEEESAVTNTSVYCRASASWDDASDLPTIIDTALFQILLHLDESEQLLSLLRSENHCHVEWCAAILTRLAKHRELVALYRGRGEHEAALAWLTAMMNAAESSSGRFETIDDDYARVGAGGRRGESGPPAEKEIARPLDPAAALIAYLSSLGADQLPLIFEYSAGAFRHRPGEALRIFTARREAASSELPRVEVLAYLTRASADAGQDLALAYLEQMIFDHGDQTRELHEALLTLYLDPPPPASSPNQPPLLKLFDVSRVLQPEWVLSRYPLTEPALYQVKAALLSKLGEHKEVLRGCIFKLRDLQQAGAYCEKVAAAAAGQDASNAPSSYSGATIFCELLELLLRPPPCDDDDASRQSRLSYAWALLKRHHRQLPPPRVFDVLPADTSLQRVHEYLVLVLKDTALAQRRAQVRLNMEKCNAVSTRLTHLRLQEKHIDIDDSTNCQTCQKKIGLSVFMYLPSCDGVVHYQCYHKSEVGRPVAKRAQDSDAPPADGPRGECQAKETTAVHALPMTGKKETGALTHSSCI